MENKTSANILLVEDDINLAYLLQENLTAKGFSVKLASTGKEGLDHAANTRFDIGILDVMLPENDGFFLARKLNSLYPEMPFIFLTARAQENDKVTGFELGAEDYITKPFSFKELFYRIQVILRRTNVLTQPVDRETILSLSSIRLHPFQRMLVINDRKQKLSQRESSLLQMLIESNGSYINRSDILKKLWGSDDYFSAKSMDVYITRIRKLIKDDPDLEIENLYGTGYRIKQNISHQ